MSEEKNALSSMQPAPGAQSSARWTIGLVALALFLACLALAFSWRALQRIEESRAEFARRLAESEKIAKEAETQGKAQQETAEALRQRLEVLEGKIAEMHNQQAALDALYQEFSRASDDRLLAEVEQAVTLAAQQLAIAGNVELAVVALENAEARLSQSGQSRYVALRQQIARDIERLRAHPAADLGGIALHLDLLAEAVPNLPLAYERRVKPTAKEQVSPSDTPPSSLHGWLSAWGREIWREISSLVRIERLDRPEVELLSPREAYFLRENLRLRLLSARLTLLARDEKGFRHELALADSWLARYFDGAHPAVIEARAQLSRWREAKIGRAFLSLDETLALLRNLKLTRSVSSKR
ncbi:MAG: uroporphyrinogen-III C-methyltransferase [Rhodocyclaceae bacterium]|nr:uroporphyrinogen-III C-methyltransferase [Rhodocyclaceae bacterium]